MCTCYIFRSSSESLPQFSVIYSQVFSDTFLLCSALCCPPVC